MKILKYLIPFNLLVDTDVGLLNLIQRDYNNRDFFFPGIVNGDLTFKKYIMLTRIQENPIEAILKVEDPDLATDLYNQFMTEEYDNILSLSTETTIACIPDSMFGPARDNLLRLTILCSTEKERQEIVKRKIQYKNIITCEPDEVDLKDYDVIFVKHTRDLDLYNNVKGKVIYVANYGFNLTFIENDPTPLLAEQYLRKYGAINSFIIYSVYAFETKDIPLP